MAWVATDNFDSYTPGAALNTANGGSDWAAAWVTNGASWTTQTAPAGGQGGVCLRNVHTVSENEAYRNIAAINAGTVSCLVRLTAIVAEDVIINLYEDAAGTGRMFIKFNDGNISIFNDPSYENFGTYVVDTWYRLYVNFDKVAQPGLYQAKIDNGTWTAWKTALVDLGAYNNIDRFRILNEATGVTLYVDDIKPDVVAISPIIIGRTRLRPRPFAPGLAR